MMADFARELAPFILSHGMGEIGITEGIREGLQALGLQFAPLEPEHRVPDGTFRKDHYGPGRQPWDDILTQGWAAPYAAGNVLKYLRRTKQPEESLKKAQWFWERLYELGAEDLKGITHALGALATQRQLLALLTREEREKLIGPEIDRTGQKHPFGFDKDLDVI